MASLEFSVPYSIPQEEALSRIKNLLTETKKEHGDKIKNLNETWEGNTGTFSFIAMGYDLAGTLAVEPGNVHLNAQIPFAVSLFKGAIIKAITEKANQLLSYIDPLLFLFCRLSLLHYNISSAYLRSWCK